MSDSPNFTIERTNFIIRSDTKWLIVKQDLDVSNILDRFEGWPIAIDIYVHPFLTVRNRVGNVIGITHEEAVAYVSNVVVPVDVGSETWA